MRTQARAIFRSVIFTAISAAAMLSIAGCPEVADDSNGGGGQVAGDRTQNTNDSRPTDRDQSVNDDGGTPDGPPVVPVSPVTPVIPVTPITPITPSPDGDDASPPDEQQQLDTLIASVRAQLADRLFETAASGGSGSDALTGINRFSLCGFGVGRIEEQTIFSGGTPTEFLDFSSDTTIDGVWSVEFQDGRLFLVLRNALVPGPESAGAPELRRFAIGLDTAGRVVSLGNSAIRDVQDIADACREVQVRSERVRAASDALANRRFVIEDGPNAAEIVLCSSGKYGLLFRQNGVAIEAEGGIWGVILQDSGLALQLDADPNQSAGQPGRTTVALAIQPDGTVQIGTGTTTPSAIAGDCEAAIGQLIGG